ncbi:immunoglobulin I-set domain protein [Ancylostoma caninum]|uniref:Immunoglobulin I-set domain protein n=1 Tax=Ancylostoma caninum TaxID=29170 RepID=A0A368G8L9_ANCCA|nr:immunoglobulin I-set domain protein [Ancylostoma caninum]
MLRKIEEAEGEVHVKNILRKESEEIIESQSNDNLTKAPIKEQRKASIETISKENNSKKLSSRLPTKKQIEEEERKVRQQDIVERKRDASVDDSTIGEPLPFNDEKEESSTSDVASTNTSANEPPPRPPKKKKNVPKALVIPYEINSLFGDPSTLRSEANITAKIRAPEGAAEAISPVKKPRSASISAKVESACKSFSRSGTPREVSAEFVFKHVPQSHIEEICFQPKMLNKLEDELNTIHRNSAAVAREGDDIAKQPGTSTSTDERIRTPNGKEKELKQVKQLEVESDSEQNKTETIFEQEEAAEGASIKRGQKTKKVSKHNDEKGVKNITIEVDEEGPLGVSSRENVNKIIPGEEEASDAAAKLLQSSIKASRQKDRKMSRVKQRTNPAICADVTKENGSGSESKMLEIHENILDGKAPENELISENQAEETDLPEDSESTSKRQTKGMQDAGDHNEARSKERHSIDGEDEDGEDFVDRARKGVPSVDDAKTSAVDRKISGEHRSGANKSRALEETQEYTSDDKSIKVANNNANIATEEETVNEQEVKKQSTERGEVSKNPKVCARTEENLEKHFEEQPSEKQVEASKTRGENGKQEILLIDRDPPTVSRKGDKEDDDSAFDDDKGQVAAEGNKPTLDSTQLSSGESKCEKESVELESKQLTTEEHKNIGTKKKSNKIGHGSEADSSPQPSSESPDERKRVKTQHRTKKAVFAATPDTEMVARAGDTLRLQCVVQDEHDSVEWFINGKPIPSNRRCSEEIAGTTRTLFVRDITPEDTGMIVEMRIGESVATSRVVIEENPAIIVKELAKEFMCEKGEPVTLEIEMNYEIRCS